MASKIFFTAIIFILTAFIALSADDPQVTGSALPFDIGDTLPDSIDLEGSDLLDFGLCYIFGRTYMLSAPEIGDIKYYYGFPHALDWDFHPRAIHIIAVRDTLFISPEGLKIGDPITKALRISESIDNKEFGKKSNHIQLPSGWHAAVDRCNDPYKLKDTQPITKSKIDFFFRARFVSPIDLYYARHLLLIDSIDSTGHVLESFKNNTDSLDRKE